MQEPVIPAKAGIHLSTSATEAMKFHNCKYLSKSAGFTLIEILVVMTVIAVAMGFIVVNIGDGGRAQKAREDIQRIVTLMRIASEEAVLLNVEIGVLFQEHGYDFFVFEMGERGGYWRGYNDDPLLRGSNWPEDYIPSLIVGGIVLPLRVDLNHIIPQVRLWSSGDVTPFILRVENPEKKIGYEIWGYANGSIEFIELKWE